MASKKNIQPLKKTFLGENLAVKEIGYHYITHNNIAVAKKFEKYRVKSN